ncbi:MAG: NTP transferase domain-containing protein [Verrucomicrobia bacterium]|nr:NTP transferase domain-containing protein [Verrucomicrobiota bacterium]
MRGSAGAILLAAGQGRRLGHDKSITAIAGRPVLSYGLGVLLQCGGIEKVVVTVREDVRQEVLAWVQVEGGGDCGGSGEAGFGGGGVEGVGGGGGVGGGT